jgi:chromate reductase, NAD(P)H dehydrogenase (quinone)
MKVLAIAGSLRADSHNRKLLEAAAGPLAELGAVVKILGSETLRSLPHFDEDIEGQTILAVERLREAIAEADGLLIATPEYNSSIPGVIKNAIDWASRPRADAALKGKPVAVVGASTTPFGAVWAQAELRKVLGSAGARAIDVELPVGNAPLAFGEDGSLVDDAGLRDCVAALVAEIERDRTARLARAA